MGQKLISREPQKRWSKPMKRGRTSLLCVPGGVGIPHAPPSMSLQRITSGYAIRLLAHPNCLMATPHIRKIIRNVARRGD